MEYLWLRKEDHLTDNLQNMAELMIGGLEGLGVACQYQCDEA